MKKIFESDLAASQKEEMANQNAYEDLKAAKEAYIAPGQAQNDSKTQGLADTAEKRARAKEDTAYTEAFLATDEQFLMMLKAKCQMTDKAWEERQKARQLEMDHLLQHFLRHRTQHRLHQHQHQSHVVRQFHAMPKLRNNISVTEMLETF